MSSHWIARISPAHVGDSWELGKGCWVWAECGREVQDLERRKWVHQQPPVDGQAVSGPIWNQHEWCMFRSLFSDEQQLRQMQGEGMVGFGHS